MNKYQDSRPDPNFSVTDSLPAEPGGKSISFTGSIFGGFDSADDQGDLLDGGLGDDVLFGGQVTINFMVEMAKMICKETLEMTD